MAMKRHAERANRTVAIALLVVLSSACARPSAHIMPMRDIAPEQQARDRAECEVVAGYLDVTKPIGGSMTAQLLYTGVGAGLGLLASPLFLPSTSDPKDVALVIGGAAAVGAALGFATGTVVGWKSGVDRAHDDYLNAYATCMRERGYTVIRDRR
jgi:hypothetical protein